MKSSVVTDVVEDADLVAAALAGGPGEFGPIVRRYQDAVFAVALARLGDFHEAQDVAQSVFVEAFGRLGSLKNPDRLGGWLRQMAIHKSVDVLRRRQPTKDLAAIADPLARDEFRRLDDREQVLWAVNRLGKSQREAITLFYIGGYSMAEVARMCGATVNTIKSRLHEARQRLKEEMIPMVQNVLQSQAPDDDFARKVFQALTGPIAWHTIVQTLREIGDKGIEGFLSALASANWRHRRNALQMQHCLNWLRDPKNSEKIVQILKRSLSDSNKKVRTRAVMTLLQLDVPRERKIAEFLPLVLPLLEDPSRRVRLRVAYELTAFHGHVPFGRMVKAFLSQPSANKLWPLREMLDRTASAKEVQEMGHPQ